MTWTPRAVPLAFLITVFAARGAVSQARPIAPDQSIGSPSTDQGGSMTTAPQEIEFYKWAMTQGGLVLVVLFGLFFYRRDFLARISEQASRVTEQATTITILTALVGQTNAAIERQTAQATAVEKSLDANASASQKVADAVEQLHRGDGGRRGGA